MRGTLSERRIRQIYQETFDRLFANVARLCVWERTLTEDIVQETWLQALNAWSTKGIPDDPLAWLIRVSRNTSINHFRRIKLSSLDTINPKEVLAVVDDGFETESREITTLVNWVIAQLSDQDAILLHSFYHGERSTSDLSLELGISLRAVEGRLRRARERLRTRLMQIPEIKDGIL